MWTLTSVHQWIQIMTSRMKTSMTHTEFMRTKSRVTLRSGSSRQLKEREPMVLKVAIGMIQLWKNTGKSSSRGRRIWWTTESTSFQIRWRNKIKVELRWWLVDRYPSIRIYLRSPWIKQLAQLETSYNELTILGHSPMMQQESTKIWQELRLQKCPAHPEEVNYLEELARSQYQITSGIRMATIRSLAGEIKEDSKQCQEQWARLVA